MNEVQNTQDAQQIKQQDIELFFVNKTSEKLANIRGHQVGSQWVAIFTEEGSTVIYPSVAIAKMVVTVKE